MEDFVVIVGQLAWPILAGCCIFYFRKPLKDALNELAGFVGRSRYGIGDDKDDLPVTDVYVPIKDVLSCRAEDRVVDVIDKMTSCGYSAVPMLSDGGCVIGALTLTRVAQTIRRNSEWSIERDVSCADLERHGQIEATEGFVFVARSAKVSQIRRHYQRQLLSHQDFHFVFITETGSKDEPLLGLVTLWDVAVMGS